MLTAWHSLSHRTQVGSASESVTVCELTVSAMCWLVSVVSGYSLFGSITSGHSVVGAGSLYGRRGQPQPAPPLHPGVRPARPTTYSQAQQGDSLATYCSLRPQFEWRTDWTVSHRISAACWHAAKSASQACWMTPQHGVHSGGHRTCPPASRTSKLTGPPLSA